MAMSRPNLELVETARDRITIVADFPQLSPALLFDYWTSIDLLKKWWPPAAELRPELGGTYHFSWPKQDWAPSGQVHHVRQREDARLHVEVGPCNHRRNQGHTTLPPNAKPGYKTHPSARRVLEELGGEENKGRTHRRLDFLSEEAPRTRPGTIKPPFRPASI